MYVQYGDYSHAINEASLVISKDSVRNDAGVSYAIRHRWQISGELMAATQADLTTAIQALEAAYSEDGSDLYLRFDDGSETAHKLLTADTTGGTHVSQPPSYPKGDGAEYVLSRGYSITVEGEVGTDAAESDVLAWDELLDFQGGGPRYVFLELRSGQPQMQLVSTETVYRVTQTGRAVGYDKYPSFPRPIWPGFEDIPSRRTSKGLPKTVGKGGSRVLREYPISWSYSFHAPFALSGNPTKRPR